MRSDSRNLLDYIKICRHSQGLRRIGAHEA